MGHSLSSIWIPYSDEVSEPIRPLDRLNIGLPVYVPKVDDWRALRILVELEANECFMTSTLVLFSSDGKDGLRPADTHQPPMILVYSTLKSASSEVLTEQAFVDRRALGRRDGTQLSLTQNIQANISSWVVSEI